MRGAGVCDTRGRPSRCGCRADPAGRTGHRPITEVLAPGALYMKNRGAGVPADKWVRVDTATLSDGNLVTGGATDPFAAAEVLRGARTATYVGRTELAGTPVHHYRGTADLAEAARKASPGGKAALAAAAKGFATAEVPFDVFLDDEGRIRKVRHRFSFVNGSEKATVAVASTTLLYAFGTPADVRLPPAEDIYAGRIAEEWPAPGGHFGDGCIHVRIDFDLLTGKGVARFRAFSEELADLVVAHGGSLSGEHGDGQARAELLPRMYGAQTVALFERAKAVWDPDDLLNPGMLVRPHPLDANLRFAPLPRRPVDVAFGYPADGGDFPAAVRRCVGVAKCRTTTVGGPSVMCPSFRATGEEEHSTRGRARLLHEMLAGEVITDGWRSTEVRDALDLCLSCKGCRSDCPVGVDMATYKAEFLHHHYAGRRRPAAHHGMGRLPQWLRAVDRTRTAPLVNALAGIRPLARLGKRLGGIAAEREIPRLAPKTFSRWWGGRRRPAGARGAEVVLWPDTFTEHLTPSVGRAAVRVLEAAGLDVTLPPSPPRRRSRVCCGLTYVSTGQLDRARTVMRRTLDLMTPVLESGTPVVVLEPSCAAALRTDLPELLSDDPRAQRLASRVLTFAESLDRLAPDWIPPRLDRPAVGQTHCHQHAVLGDGPDRRLRAAAGLTGELSGGCCGLAGDFGFARGHYAVSAACAEEQLLPAVREAPEGAVVLADGFSCRTQLEQLGGVRGRHLAEVLAEGMDARPAPEDAP
ncbi:Lactate utilization protein A [Streptomyces glaucescens]